MTSAKLETVYRFEDDFFFTAESAKAGIEAYEAILRGATNIPKDDARMLFDTSYDLYKDNQYIKWLAFLFDGPMDYKDTYYTILSRDDATLKGTLRKDCGIDSTNVNLASVVVLHKRYCPVDNCVIPLNDSTRTPKFTCGKLLRRFFRHLEAKEKIRDGVTASTEVEDLNITRCAYDHTTVEWNFPIAGLQLNNAPGHFYELIHCGSMLELHWAMQCKLTVIRRWRLIGARWFMYGEAPSEILVDYANEKSEDNPYSETVLDDDAHFSKLYSAPYQPCNKVRDMFVLPAFLAWFLKRSGSGVNYRWSIKLKAIAGPLNNLLRNNAKLAARGWEGIFFSFLSHVLSHKKEELKAIVEFHEEVVMGQFQLLENNGKLHDNVREMMTYQLGKWFHTMENVAVASEQKAVYDEVLLRAFCLDRMFFFCEKEDNEMLLLSQAAFLTRPELFSYKYVPTVATPIPTTRQAKDVYATFSPYDINGATKSVGVLLFYLYFSPTYNTAEVKQVIQFIKEKAAVDTYETTVNIFLLCERARVSVLSEYASVALVRGITIHERVPEITPYPILRPQTKLDPTLLPPIKVKGDIGELMGSRSFFKASELTKGVPHVPRSDMLLPKGSTIAVIREEHSLPFNDIKTSWFFRGVDDIFQPELTEFDADQLDKYTAIIAMRNHGAANRVEWDGEIRSFIKDNIPLAARRLPIALMIEMVNNAELPEVPRFMVPKNILNQLQLSDDSIILPITIESRKQTIPRNEFNRVSRRDLIQFLQPYLT